MGMVITLCLISFNVYNNVEGPSTRGFSYIEMWMVGMEIPIVLAVLEYLAILGMQRWFGNLNKIDKIASKMDGISCLVSFTYFLVFSSYYWLYAVKNNEMNLKTII